MFKLGFVGWVAILALINGCAGMSKPGFPDQSVDDAQLIAELERLFATGKEITDYYDTTKTPVAQQTAKRNEIVNGRIILMDLHYNRFLQRISLNKQTLDTVTDFIELGVNLAIPLVSGAGTKDILGVVSAGITGTKLTIDKNFFYERTVPVLITAMNAQRKVALFPILEGITKPAAQYSLEQALSDLNAYYFAGTFVGALQAIQADSGAKEVKAQTEIAKLRSSTFGEDESSKRLRSWLFDADVNPRKENVTKLRDWMAKVGLQELPIQKLLDHPDLKESRKKAIDDLTVPAIN